MTEDTQRQLPGSPDSRLAKFDGELLDVYQGTDATLKAAFFEIENFIGDMDNIEPVDGSTVDTSDVTRAVNAIIAALSTSPVPPEDGWKTFADELSIQMVEAERALRKENVITGLYSFTSRTLKIGYRRAQFVVEALEQAGVLTPDPDSQNRWSLRPLPAPPLVREG